MDKKTIQVYDQGAQHYAEDWLAQPAATEIHDLVRKYFIPAGVTADIGCGSGRDTQWLVQAGYLATGFDASEGLLGFARQTFPHCKFEFATLPALGEIPSGVFDNVLCETVLQHLPADTHLEALKNLLRILKPNGVLSMSFRHPAQVRGDREKDERLYILVDTPALAQQAQAWGAQVLHQATLKSPSSGKTISQLIVKL